LHRVLTSAKNNASEKWYPTPAYGRTALALEGVHGVWELAVLQARLRTVN
jgi:hypothetical protein